MSGGKRSAGNKDVGSRTHVFFGKQRLPKGANELLSSGADVLFLQIFNIRCLACLSCMLFQSKSRSFPDVFADGRRLRKGKDAGKKEDWSGISSSRVSQTQQEREKSAMRVL